MWDISSITTMSGMFYGASSFNQDLCLWGDNFPYDDSEMTSSVIQAAHFKFKMTHHLISEDHFVHPLVIDAINTDDT